MDATAHAIRRQRNLLPLDLPEGYVEQIRAPVRFAARDELGRVAVGYRSTGPDDFFMAEAFDLIATDLWAYQVRLDYLSQSTMTTAYELAGLSQPFELDPAEDDELDPDEEEEHFGPTGGSFGPDDPW